MFESAEIDHHIDKQRYKEEAEPLRQQLLAAQFAMLEARKQGVLVVVAGVDGGGKGETVQLLNSWLDPRRVQTHAFGDPSDEERERPPLWRYWRALPPRGEIGIFFDSWYMTPILARAHGSISEAEFDATLEDIRRFERMLSDEGFVLLKLWFHLSRAQQRKRLRELESDDDTRWRVTESDWDHYRHHREISEAAARALRLTSHEFAPWIVVPGSDERYRSLVTARALLDAMVNDDGETKASEPAVHPVPPLDGRNVLSGLDLSQRLEKDEYEHELEHWQGELARIVLHKRFRRRAAVVVFEGMDAAGKGGAIRRVAAALDPRRYHITPIAAPSDEEKARPYLWRFWRHLPRRGKLAIFDRSWYGRVLVERVEGFCSTTDWLRAYGEINDFEEQLDENGTVVIKLWLHIDLETQLARFSSRQTDPFKQYKIGPDDWRNREKWPAYENAISDMIDRTSTECARWTLVEAADKNFARIKVLRTICERLRERLDID